MILVVNKRQQPGDRLKGGAFSTGCCSVFDIYYAEPKCLRKLFSETAQTTGLSTTDQGVVCNPISPVSGIITLKPYASHDDESLGSCPESIDQRSFLGDLRK